MKVTGIALALAIAAASAAAVVPPSSAEPLQALLDRAEALRSSDPREFSATLRQVEALTASATADQLEQLQYLRAYELAYSGRFDDAIVQARTLFEASDDPGIRLRAGALAVNSLAATRDFAEGLRQLDRTLELVERVPDPELRSHAWFAASALYTQIGQFALASHYADRVLVASRDPRSHCFAGQQKLEAEYQNFLASEPDVVIRPPSPAEIEETIAACDALGETIVTSFSRSLLARVHEQQGGRAEAMAILEDNLAAIEGTRYPRLIGEVHSLLARLYFENGDDARATQHAREALARSSEMAFSLPLVQAHETLYRVAERRGDFAAAFDHYRRYAQADKAYLDAVKARELAFQAVRQETEEKNRTIQRLDDQNRLLQLEQKVAQQAARNTQLLVALLLVLLTVIVYWAWKTKRTQMVFRRMAELDALTRSSNRHHFTRSAELTLDRCQRDGEAVAMVMFDLDEFKSINDRFGHGVGDWVLRQVADACRGCIRRADLLGRIGGEEFAVLLPGATAAEGIVLAEKCREALHRIDTQSTGRDFRISGSFGVADTLRAGFDFNKLLASADAAMYAAKRGGRDRVAVFTPDLDGMSPP